MPIASPFGPLPLDGSQRRASSGIRKLRGSRSGRVADRRRDVSEKQGGAAGFARGRPIVGQNQ
jgi:hypothetical protein